MADAREEVGFVISRGNLALGISLEKNGRASMRHPPFPHHSPSECPSTANAEITPGSNASRENKDTRRIEEFAQIR